jgi:hypothetical protein
MILVILHTEGISLGLSFQHCAIQAISTFQRSSGMATYPKP